MNDETQPGCVLGKGWEDGTASAEAPRWDGTCLFRERKGVIMAGVEESRKAGAEDVREVVRAGRGRQAMERGLDFSEGKWETLGL